MYFLVSNVGKPLSYTKLATMIAVASPATVKDYLSYLEAGFLFFTLPRWSFSVKKQLYAPKKVYVIDNGLAQTLSFRFSENQGRLLENVVFGELKRRGGELFYHAGDYECDFLVYCGGGVERVVQVCASLEDVVTRERELRGLWQAMDEHGLQEGLLLTLDEWGEERRDGKVVYIIPVWKWMLEY